MIAPVRVCCVRALRVLCFWESDRFQTYSHILQRDRKGCLPPDLLASEITLTPVIC